MNSFRTLIKDSYYYITLKLFTDLEWHTMKYTTTLTTDLKSVSQYTRLESK